MKVTTALRALLDTGEIVFRPGVAIALHALMAEKLGFKAVGVSAGQFAAHVLGLPDAGLISSTEIIENIRRVASAVSIPVIADLDTAGESAINVRRTVREVIRAGAAGIYFEDQAGPKRCGFAQGKRLLPLDEAVAKFRAASDQRREDDADFVIFARTDARTAAGGSLDEVMRRCQAYKKAGADVICVEALQSVEEIRQVRAGVQGPLACSLGAIEQGLTLDELQELGLSITLGTMFFKAGTIAAWDLLADMKARGMTAFDEFTASSREHVLGHFGTLDLTGFPKIVAWERQYLSEGELQKYENSTGIYQPATSEIQARRPSTTDEAPVRSQK